MNEAQPTLLDLYSGIGGFSLGFEREGFRTIAFAETDPDASRVLQAHWPQVPNLGNVSNHCDWPEMYIDVISAGVPCSPTSYAGQRRGTGDERWLWPETIAVVGQYRPFFFIAENPPSLLTLERGTAFNRIISGISTFGYDLWWDVIPAAAVGAKHLRERLIIIAANPSCLRQSRQRQPFKSCGKAPCPDWQAGEFWNAFQRKALPYVCPETNGLPGGLVKSAVRCCGNAVVPQIPQLYARAIKQLL